MNVQSTTTPTTDTFHPYAISPATLKQAEDRGILRTGWTEATLADRMAADARKEGHRPRMPEMNIPIISQGRVAMAQRVTDALKAGPLTAKGLRAVLGADYHSVYNALLQLERDGKVASDRLGSRGYLRWRLTE